MLGRNGLQDIQINNDYLDIDAIRQKPVEEWFEESDDREGWEGLLNEIYNQIGDRNAELVWDIWGSEEFKQEFSNCLNRYNVPVNHATDIPIENMQEKIWANAEKYDHRGQYEEAFKLYKNLADNYNFADAQFKVGEYYFNNYVGINGNKEKAFLYYEKAAKQGNKEAEFWVGRCYDRGDGVQKNRREAVKWYQKAAEKGHPKALNNLGMSYMNGNGIEKNETIAIELLKKAAELGSVVAQYNLAGSYEEGIGTKKDYKEAMHWYEKAAEKGNSKAQESLGRCYYFGKCVDQNYKEAVKWFQKAAEQGEEYSQYCLGYCYYYGEGTEKNVEKAVYWYTKAAENENGEAQENLGDCYWYEIGDRKEAAKWYRKAAEQGKEHSQFLLGLYYYGGEVEQNLEEAVHWLKKAAEQGHSLAQVSLGDCYRDGQGVEENVKEAMRWYQKAAEQGEAQAEYNLGWLYLYNIEIGLNKAEALRWYKRAAAHGDEDIIRRIKEDKIDLDEDSDNPTDPELQCQKGEECEKEGRYREAFEWYRKASDQGDQSAMLNIADLYMEGKGVEADKEKAVTMLKKLSEAGNSLASHKLGMFYLGINGGIYNKRLNEKYMNLFMKQIQID